MVQKFGAFDAMRTMVGVLREVSLDDVRQQAETVPRLMVVGPTEDDARRLGNGLAGPEGEYTTVYRGVQGPAHSVSGLDAVVVWDPERTGAASRVAESLRFESPTIPIVAFEGFHSHDAEALERTRADIVKRNPERAAAFGRALPAFRSAATNSSSMKHPLPTPSFHWSNIPAMLLL